MELAEWKKKKEGMSQDGYMLRLNEREAIELINSITNQLMSGSSNAGRVERCDCRHLSDAGDRQVYFSVAVTTIPKK